MTENMATHIKLPRHWSEYLLKKPESGMGYQRVDVRFADGRHLENTVVLHCELLEVPDSFAEAEVRDLTMHHG